MGTVVFRRPPRRPGPQLPRGELVLEAPPELLGPAGSGPGQVLTVLPMAAGAGGMALFYAAGNAGPASYIAGGLIGVALLGIAVAQLSVRSAGRGSVDVDRRDYLRYLSQMRRRVRRAAEQQYAALTWRNPAPDTLWSFVASNRLWERRPTDGDFGEVRLAVGTQRLAVDLVPPDTKSVEDLEPLTAMALRRFIRVHSALPRLPIAVSLRAFGRVALRGDREPVLDLIRAMLAQFVTLHAPDDARIAVVTSPARRGDWEWVKWLPHAQRESRSDGAGALRLVFTSSRELEQALDDEFHRRPRLDTEARPSVDRPHLVVVLDGGEVDDLSPLRGPGLLGVTVLDATEDVPRDAGRWLLALNVRDDQLEVQQGSGVVTLGSPDRLPAPAAEALARQLAPLRLPRHRTVDRVTLPQLLDIGDLDALDWRSSWRTRRLRNYLRVPLGAALDGVPVELDLKASALDGMGPHGLVVGATGSGKSELLRSLVATLAVTHDPAVLNLLLVDAAGRSTFAALDGLPHTSAVLTELCGDDLLVDRLQQTIVGEMVRRQKLLKDSGNHVSRHEYERSRANGAPLEPLPSLLIVIDEFGELLTAHPGFSEVLVLIGRLGRSLGLHMLLASQRLEESRLRGFETHLSYRIALRTFSAVESRVVLGIPDAYELPRTPGHGYLKIDSSAPLRFVGPNVSGPYRSATRRRSVSVDVAQRIVPLTTEYVPPTARPADPAEEADSEPRPSTLDVLVRRLAGHGAPARRMWLPPLDRPSTLDRFPAVRTGDRRLPVGVVDRPQEQLQPPLLVDLTGHVAVVGGSRSGKTTLLASLVAGLAFANSPAGVTVVCLDIDGTGLGGLAALPQVSGVAALADKDSVAGLVARVLRRLDGSADRSTTGGGDPAAAGPLRDLYLVVDGWAGVPQHGAALARIAADGPAAGVHLLVTANRPAELPAPLRGSATVALELRLDDPGDSEIDQRAAGQVPAGRPGRGITHEALHFLGALPRLDGDDDPATLADGMADLVVRIRSRWADQAAPPAD